MARNQDSKSKPKKRNCESDEDHEYAGFKNGGEMSPLTYELDNDHPKSARSLDDHIQVHNLD